MDQEIFPAIATHKFTAFVYVKMEILKIIKSFDFEVTFFAFLKLDPSLKSESFLELYRGFLFPKWFPRLVSSLVHHDWLVFHDFLQ